MKLGYEIDVPREKHGTSSMNDVDKFVTEGDTIFPFMSDELHET